MSHVMKKHRQAAFLALNARDLMTFTEIGRAASISLERLPAVLSSLIADAVIEMEVDGHRNLYRACADRLPEWTPHDLGVQQLRIWFGAKSVGLTRALRRDLGVYDPPMSFVADAYLLRGDELWLFEVEYSNPITEDKIRKIARFADAIGDRAITTLLCWSPRSGNAMRRFDHTVLERICVDCLFPVTGALTHRYETVLVSDLVSAIGDASASAPDVLADKLLGGRTE